MRRVVWSRDALDEFADLVDYVARDNPPAAMSIADRIDAAVTRLAEMPTGRRGRVGCVAWGWV